MDLRCLHVTLNHFHAYTRINLVFISRRIEDSEVVTNQCLLPLNARTKFCIRHSVRLNVVRTTKMEVHETQNKLYWEFRVYW